MTPITAMQAVEHGYRYGMFQHLTEITAFVNYLLQERPARILEIGMHRGGTSALFSTIATEMCIGVDLPDGPWGGIGWIEASKRNEALAAEFPTFRAVVGNSRDVSTFDAVRFLLGDHKVDLLFIDADHSYDGVRADFETYRWLVRPGGMIAFHDIKMDAPIHVRDNVEVPRFWRDLCDTYSQHIEFILPEGEWGGIGVVRV